MSGATSEGTSRYTTDKIEGGLPARAFKTFGRTGWKASALGFGCYRIDDRISAHREALEKALRQGCNVIDTSINYADGHSEQAVGMVIKELIASGVIHRDEIIVMSKIGYVQGRTLKVVMEREKQGKPYPDVVKYIEGCWHCIHHDFIEEQLTESLKRLQLDHLDVLFLHNPEYFLMDSLNKQPDMRLDKVRDILYDRITRAFRRLEDEVDAGRIGCYGVSSNTFGRGVHEIDATSIATMWEIACHVSKDRTGNPYQHHFSVVQFPANILETGAILLQNNEESKTAIEFASGKELAVLINRPLNAIQGNQMIRLADLAVSKVAQSATKQMKEVCRLEEVFKQKLAPQIKTSGGALSPNKFFVWGTELSKANLKTFGLEQWKHIEFQVIRPQVSQLSQAMDLQMKGDFLKEWQIWRDNYTPSLMKLLEVIRNDFSKRSQKQIKAISKKVDALLPKALQTENLSRKVLAILLNTPGITCILNGMRRPKYVDDSLGILRFKPLKVDKDLYNKLHS